MKFRSTRRKSTSRTINSAILSGIAEDGGLFVPEEWPVLNIDAAWARRDFASFAVTVLKPFFAGDPLESRLEDICTNAFDFPVPLADLGHETAALELFHGPTSAFKDLGARFLAVTLNSIKVKDPRSRLVLVATSGDTGGAVAAAFAELTSTPVIILYPKGRISPRQEKQLTVWGPQVRAFAVGGTFDDCQRMAKEAFASAWWTQRYRLISANSINLARLLPQMAAFAYASLQYQAQHGTAAGIAVPSGNVGNAVAALWARRIGFPIRKVLFAHNANRAVYDYFQTGTWTPRPTVATLANAMDVGEPSNFERVLDLFPQVEDLRRVAASETVSDAEIRSTVKAEWDRHRRIWCPHSAIAVHARNLQKDPHWIVTATAHPAKFETILEPIVGSSIEIPPGLQALLSLPSNGQEIAPDLTSLQTHI